MNQASEGKRPAGRQTWILVVVLVAAVILATTIGARKKAAGSLSRPRIGFGAHIAPPTGPNRTLAFNNGWIAAARKGDAIAVYAGAQPSNRQNGEFLIQRQSGGGPHPISRTIVVRGSGALTLLRPALPPTEAAALQETLHFVTASGTTGTLDLSDDKVALSG